MVVSRATLAVVVTLKFLAAPLLMIFAVCLALAGQARAIDDAGDSDDVVCGADDLVFVAVERVLLDPPSVRTQALPLPSESNSGRRVIADLFRPPIAA